MSEKSLVMEGEEYSLVSAAGFSQDENPMRFLKTKRTNAAGE